MSEGDAKHDYAKEEQGSNEDYRERFRGDKAYSYESKTYQKNSYYSLMWKIEKKYLENFLKEQDRFNTYLDFACGSGRVIELVENYVVRSVGIDVSSQMLEITSQKVKKSKLVLQDISKEGLKEKFDLITAYRFFLNAQEDLRHSVVAEFSRSTNDNSVIIVSNQGNKTSFRFFIALLHRIMGKRLNQLSKNEFMDLFAPYGFNLVQYRGIGVLPKFLYKVRPLVSVFYSIDLILYRLKIFSYISQNHTYIFAKTVPNK